MANSLRSAINSLATSFADSVLAAIRGASLEELHADGGGRRRSSTTRPAGARVGARRTTTPRRTGGRLARRSAADIEKTLAQVRSLLRGKKAGLRSEQILKALHLDKRELPRVLRTGLKAKQLRSKGEKRGTTYFAA